MHWLKSNPSPHFPTPPVWQDNLLPWFMMSESTFRWGTSRITLQNYLMIIFNQIYLAEDFGACKSGYTVMNVRQRIVVPDGGGIQASVIPKWTPCSIFFLYHVKCWRHWPLEPLHIPDANMGLKYFFAIANLSIVNLHSSLIGGALVLTWHSTPCFALMVARE